MSVISGDCKCSRERECSKKAAENIEKIPSNLFYPSIVIRKKFCSSFFSVSLEGVKDDEGKKIQNLAKLRVLTLNTIFTWRETQLYSACVFRFDLFENNRELVG